MNAQSSREDRARALFDDALQQPAADREAFLGRACAGDPELLRELGELLRLHEEAGELLREPAAPVGEQAGERIGRFRLLERIGEGGFGTVWMAEQEEPVRRKVALKVLKAGMDTAQVVARFEAERQALALMEHPNIAKVFDGGATARGRPYFAMELVRGVPITKYCDEASLSPRERLELFIPVCQAVQHAHFKGVIHRDLKPSNVLVTLHDGVPVPKVIDFGIAKATQGRLTERTLFTGFQQMLGTPEYMAPEQAELSGLDVDTRADVYSLGVLLYELLTGTRPFDLKTLLQAGYAEMLRTIKEVEPQRPSTRVSTLGDRLPGIAKHRRMHPRALSPLMRGDLDWIVMKTLEKERNRRYATATALAEDVQRHLRNEPVHAGPPSRLYKLRKYAQRHRVGVVACVAVTAALIAGTIASSLGYVEARAQSEMARREVTKSRKVVGLLSSMLDSNDPHTTKGPDYPVRMVLAEFEASLAGQLQGEPEVEAELRRVVGRTYLGLGMPEAAEPHLLKALQMQSTLDGARGLEGARASHAMARLRHAQHRYTEALEILEAADVVLEDGSQAVADVRDEGRSMRAECLTHIGRLPEAESLSREVLADLRSRFGEESVEVAVQTGLLAVILEAEGKLAEAEDRCADSLAMKLRLLGPDDYQVAVSLTHQARILRSSGRPAEAEATIRQALEIAQEALGDGHPAVASLVEQLADLLANRGDPAGAEDLYRRALEIRRKPGGNSHLVSDVCHKLAQVLFIQGELEEAERLAREAVEIRRAAQGQDPRVLPRSLLILAQVLYKHDQPVEAERLAREALAMGDDLEGEDAPSLFDVLALLSLTAEQRGDPDEAERLALEALRRLGGAADDKSRRLIVLNQLCNLLYRSGQVAKAEPYFREAMELCTELRNGSSPSDTEYSLRYGLAQCWIEQGKRSEAEDLARESLTLAQQHHGARSTQAASQFALLANVLLRLDRSRDAEPHARECLAIRASVIPGTWQHYSSMALLGISLAGQGRAGEAEPLLVQACTEMQPPKLNVEPLRSSLTALIALYEQQGNLEAAGPWRAKLEQLAPAAAANRDPASK